MADVFVLSKYLARKSRALFCRKLLRRKELQLIQLDRSLWHDICYPKKIQKNICSVLFSKDFSVEYRYKKQGENDVRDDVEDVSDRTDHP